MPISHEALQTLPQVPHLDHLKHQARALQRGTRLAEPEALGRVAASHPRFAELASVSSSISLGDAQLVVAREYGFASWARLKAHVESARRARPAKVTLPVVRVHRSFLVPEVAMLFHFSSAEQRVVEAALAQGSPLLCIAEGGSPSLEGHGAIAWPTAPTSGRAGRQQTLLRVRARAKVLAVRSEESVLVGDAEPELEFSWSHASKREAVARLHAALERLSLRVVWISRPELTRLRTEGDLGGLLARAVKHLEPSELAECSTLSNPVAAIELVCRSLEQRAEREQVPILAASPVVARRDTPEASVVVLRAEAHPHARGRRYDLHAEVTRIGRAESCEIELYSDSVSRVHARIERVGADFFVVDEGSTNGTFRQGEEERITRQELANGDRLIVGDAILCFSRGGDLDEKYRTLVDELGREDPLTRLDNRARWLAELERRVLLSRGDRSALSVVTVDIDGLRAFNERLGRLAGDRIIVEVAHRLRVASAGAALGRFGEGTFCVTLSSEQEHALSFAEALRRAVGSHPIFFEGEAVDVTVSAGVGALDATLGTEELVERALAALRHAKADGGDRVASLASSGA
jgi:diguanylate cyclase (GGDEF)-like protein